MNRTEQVRLISQLVVDRHLPLIETEIQQQTAEEIKYCRLRHTQMKSVYTRTNIH